MFSIPSFLGLDKEMVVFFSPSKTREAELVSMSFQDGLLHCYVVFDVLKYILFV